MKPGCTWILAALAAAGCQTSDLQRAEPVFVEQVDYTAMATPQLLQSWLLEDCALPADGALVAVLRDRRAEVVPMLRPALEEGPPQELTAEIEEDARERFAGSRKALEDSERLGLSGEAVERASQGTEARFVARARNDLETGYRAQALLGLVAILGSEADALVDEVAADRESPARATALLLQRRRR